MMLSVLGAGVGVDDGTGSGGCCLVVLVVGALLFAIWFCLCSFYLRTFRVGFVLLTFLFFCFGVWFRFWLSGCCH